MTALLRRTAAQPEPADPDVYRVTWYDVRGPHHSGQLTQQQAGQRYSAELATVGHYQVHLLTEAHFREWVGEIARRVLGEVAR